MARLSGVSSTISTTGRPSGISGCIGCRSIGCHPINRAQLPVKVVKHETACRFAQWREGIGEFGMVLPGFLELRDEAFHVPEFKEAAKLMGERRGQRQHGLRGRCDGVGM